MSDEIKAAIQRGREQGVMLAWLYSEVDGITIREVEYDLHTQADDAARALIARSPNVLRRWEHNLRLEQERPPTANGEPHKERGGMPEAP